MSTQTQEQETLAATFSGPIPEERAPNLIEKGMAMAARTTTEADDQAVKFAESLGADTTQIQRLNDALDIAAITEGNDPRRVQTVLAEIVGTKKPEELLNAFEKTDPSLKPFLDVVREDQNFAAAIHNAVSKDITVLGGLQSMAGDGSSLDQEGMIQALNDPQNRALFSNLLNATAENPDLDFSDFSEALNAGIDMSADPTDRQKQERYINSLQRFGMRDIRADMLNQMGTPIEMLGQMWENPHGFFDSLAELLGGNPAQVEALKSLGGFMADFVGMFSQDPNIRSFMAEYGPKATSFGNALIGNGQSTDLGDLVGSARNVDVGGLTLRGDFSSVSQSTSTTPAPDKDVAPIMPPPAPAQVPFAALP
jgi:hypothetical protein